MELTEDQKTDSEVRRKAFLEKYGALVKETQCDFFSTPAFVPMGQGMFGVAMNMQIVDTKYLPQKSPIQKEDIIHD